MFEKEAKKWVKENTRTEHSASFGDIKVEPSAEKGFQKGAEFGYNKANEWHYPSKGEYPEKGKEILLYTKTLGLIFGEFCEGYNNLWTSNRCDFMTEEIIAWAEKEKILPKEKNRMFDLNELAVIAYENAAKREAKDGKVSTDTMKMLKHTATEVVEAVESFVAYRDIKNLAEDLNATDLDEKWESQEEPDVCEEHYQKTRKQFASELADIVCCVLIIAGKENIDMEYALTACMEKNYKRAIGKGDK